MPKVVAPNVDIDPIPIVKLFRNTVTSMDNVKNRYHSLALISAAKPVKQGQPGETEPSKPLSQPVADNIGKVQLTNESQNLLRLAKSNPDISAINKAKISAIRQALENGQYHIETTRLASNIIKLESLLQPLDQSKRHE